MHLAQQRHDLRADCIQIGIDFNQIAWRLVLVEVSVEGNFVTDDTNLAILGVALASIYPGIRYMRLHFLDEICLVYGVDRSIWVEGDVFKVTQFAIGLVFDDFTIDGKQPI